ncbi:MAG TPA: SDR family NAD(P)-dependent oxidoreductase, partial [Kofleriaceae bacterium]|nr:SDR family NAD(P)-dependent oxidoreductase [Kofleriaceae bacterium]
MTTQLRFDGKVAIVTGSGGGLGRSHALLLASRGAKLVVNDLGGSHTGEGKSASAADKVVAEIKAAGGEAVANYDSVEDGDKIVKTAVDAFGRIDIVINNAGILRDVSFQKMTQTDWDLVYRVHVLGAFRVIHAAWPHMRDAGYGRIVNTSSASGIYGNFGQANYSMAKLGLHGLSQTLALEGKKRNIVVNTIAPTAGSRMTETVMPPALVEALKPELVSPLVARLVHESQEDTGGLYEVGGGFFAKLRWERSTGKTFRLGRSISIEDVDAAMPAITQFDKTTHPENINLALQPLIENVEAGPSKGGNQFIDVDAALGHKYPEYTSSYDERDVALYALGVGAAKDPTDERDLQLVYEMSGRGMKVLPSFGVLPAINMVFSQAKQGINAPGLSYGLDRVLHGEQYTELKRPLPTR